MTQFLSLSWLFLSLFSAVEFVLKWVGLTAKPSLVILQFSLVLSDEHACSETPRRIFT